jgi:hypothetical protein
MDWMGMKGVAAQLSVEKDALHVYAAFVVQIAAAALFRKSLGHWLPWLAVLAVELANEALDMQFGEEAHVQHWQLIGARHDIVNTMILPTLLLLLCRFAPVLFRPAAPSPAADAAGTPPKDEIVLEPISVKRSAGEAGAGASGPRRKP